jgi:hypothetical protein
MLSIQIFADKQAMVFGSFGGLLNLVIFLMLVTLIASLVAVQLLRGDMPEGDTITFSQTYNSFLGMYQVSRSLVIRHVADNRYSRRRIGLMCCLEL